MRHNETTAGNHHQYAGGDGLLSRVAWTIWAVVLALAVLQLDLGGSGSVDTLSRTTCRRARSNNTDISFNILIELAAHCVGIIFSGSADVFCQITAVLQKTFSSSNY